MGNGAVPVEELEKQFAITAVDLQYKNLPVKPEEGKWTKTGGSADWLTMVTAPCVFFNLCYESGYKVKEHMKRQNN